MGYEILYTSAPSGLKPGSSGYCTVQSSRGIPAPAVDLLESLSGYRHVFAPGSPEAAHNPVNWGHYVVRIAGRSEHVLSRVGDCELDYTGRSNKLAHHTVVDAMAVATLPGGPAWFLARPGQMRDQWDGTVSQLGNPRIPAPERRTAGQCAAWGQATGDAGWGGVLAESFLADPERKVFVIYKPGTNLLALFDEAIALLPEHRRWDVTFATYGAALPKTVECLWSGLVAGSPEVAQSHRFVNALRIDLTQRISRAAGGPIVELARTGVSTARTPLSQHRPTSQAHTVPITEPIYNGGYQPVPPPPAILGAPVPFDGPEPPSLPPRSTPKGRSNLLTYGLASVIFAAIVGTSVAAVLWLRQSPLPLSTPEPTSVAANSDENSSAPPWPTPPSEPTEVKDKASPKTDVKEESSPKDSPATPPLPPPGDTATPDSPPQQSPTPVETPGGVQNPSTPKASEQPDAKGVKVVAINRRTHLAGRKGSVQLPLPGKGRLGVDLVSEGSLYVPRGLTQTSLYDVASQSMSRRNLDLVARKGGFPTPIVDIDLSSIGTKSPKIEITPKTVSPHQLLALQYGALLLHDAEKGVRTFVVFGPAVPQEGAYSLDGHSLQVRFPEEIKDLITEIMPTDLVLDEITLAHQQAGQSVSLRPIGSREWNLEPISDGVIQSIELLQDIKVLPNRQLHLSYKFHPELGDLSVTSKSQKVGLDAAWIAIERQLPPPVAKAVSDLIQLPDKLPQDESSLNNAISDFKGMFPKLPEGDNDAAAKRAKFIDEIDAYLKSLSQYRRRVQSIARATSGLEAVSGRFQYRVWPVPVGEKSEGIAEHPDHKDSVLIDLFEFHESR